MAGGGVAEGLATGGMLEEGGTTSGADGVPGDGGVAIFGAGGAGSPSVDWARGA